MDFIQHHNKASLRLCIPCLCFQHASFNTRTASLAHTSDTSMSLQKILLYAKNISVQCQHILKEHVIKKM